ncbi:hypothetical protein J7U61_24300, partial [Escherichia coli]|nr:hypothetical protein [Escherichia coli]
FSDPGPVFHTIVSIKNDGHYFCRAGGNRPDGLNEPVTYYLPDVKPYPVLFLQNQQRIYKVRKAVQAQFRSVQALHAKRFAYYG